MQNRAEHFRTGSSRSGISASTGPK
jgi:hypothetical protein